MLGNRYYDEKKIDDLVASLIVLLIDTVNLTENAYEITETMLGLTRSPEKIRNYQWRVRVLIEAIEGKLKEIYFTLDEIKINSEGF